MFAVCRSRARLRALMPALAVSVLVVLVGAACDVQAEVEVDLRGDGSGTVSARIELDEEALSRLERISDDDVASGAVLPVADLVAAGWVTEGLVPVDSGGAELVLVHEFGAPGEVAPLVAQLSGESGLLTDVVVRRDHTLWHETDEVSLGVDLGQANPGVAADGELAASLTALGVDPVAVDEILATELAESVSVSVTATAGDSSQTVTVAPGESATATATSERNRIDRVLLLVAAAALAALALAAALGLAVSLARRAHRGSRSTIRAARSEPEDGVDLVE